MADRYISDKALIENIAKIEDLRTLSTKTIGEAISKTPTADVVEVVRCKDCRMFAQNKEAFVSYCKREHKNLTVNPNDFCSYGERKE